ncbi:hypothetical protein GCM10009657_16040 [Oryzihumus leptocrescens]
MVGTACLLAASLAGCGGGQALSAKQAKVAERVLFEPELLQEIHRRDYSAQRETSACMRAYGWSIPAPAVPTLDRSVEFDDRSGPPTKPWATAYGLGIYADMTEENISFAEQGATSVPTYEQIAGRLPGKARQRFLSNLYGSFMIQGGAVVPTSATSGCYAGGYVKYDPLRNAVYTLPRAAQQDFRSVSARVDATAEVKGAAQAWSSCMAGHGYDLGGRSYHELVGWVTGQAPLKAIGKKVVKDDPPGAAAPRLVTIDRYDPQEFQRAESFEFKVAAAAADCGEATRLREVIAAARHRLAASWLRANGAQLRTAVLAEQTLEGERS